MSLRSWVSSLCQQEDVCTHARLRAGVTQAAIFYIAWSMADFFCSPPSSAMQTGGRYTPGLVLQAVLQHVQKWQEERYESGQVRRWRMSDLADFQEGFYEAWLKAGLGRQAMSTSL
jgi:hypothetical protein